MVTKEYVRKKYFVDGWSIRKISRQAEISRQTVRKMLRDSAIPKYRSVKARPSPVMGRYSKVIQRWLKEDEKAPPKQRHTARRIYTRLVEEYGFKGGESTVRRFVRLLKQEPKECFMLLTASPGEQAQVDFGHAWVIIGDKRYNVSIFCMRLKYSSVPYTVAFLNERLEAFLEGHVKAFEYFGGVPKEGIYDNAKTQIVKILQGPGRQEHEAFSNLRAHYLFNSTFCRPGHGNEKGSVENLVKYVRRNALVPVSSFANMEELNEHLLRWCDKEEERHMNRWLEEKEHLRPLPDRGFCSARILPIKVNRYALVNIERNKYSVPAYVGKTLIAKIYTDRVEIVDLDKIVASHKRSYERGKTYMKFEHYISVLERKPHSVTHARVVRELPEVFQRLRERLENERGNCWYKEYLQILLLAKEYSLEEIELALERAGEMVNVQIVERYLLNETEGVPTLYPVVDEKDMMRYDNLLRRSGT